MGKKQPCQEYLIAIAEANQEDEMAFTVTANSVQEAMEQAEAEVNRRMGDYIRDDPIDMFISDLSDCHRVSRDTRIKLKLEV